MNPAMLIERGALELVVKNAHRAGDDLPFWGGEVDCCINTWTVMSGVWLGAEVSRIVAWFIEHRPEDGGWNCEWVDAKTVSPFDSALNSPKGLPAYQAM